MVDTADVVIRGEIDSATAPHLRQALTDASTSGATALVLGLREVTYLDSAGIDVLFEHARHVRLTVKRGSPLPRVPQISGPVGVVPVDVEEPPQDA